ncbi:MAG: glycosyltransferase [Acidimicrobiales bacterium]
MTSISAHPEPNELVWSGGRTVVAHDYLTQRGGAERVAMALSQTFGDAPLVTSVYEPSSTFEFFQTQTIEVLWLNAVRAFRRDPRRAFPFLARAFSNYRVRDADLIVCSTSGWAHGIDGDAPRLVYCYTPARWLYQQQDFLLDQGLAKRLLLRAAATHLRSWDLRAAHRASIYIATSSVIADRISQAYNIEARVIPPPITIRTDLPQEPTPGLQPGFLLTVGRPRGYKNLAPLIAAMQDRPNDYLVIVGSHLAGPRVRGLGFVTEAELRWLYTNCTALITVSSEDFGLTPLEANAFGKPVIALRQGGFLDTVIEDCTGLYVEKPDPKDIVTALHRLESHNFRPHELRQHAQKYTFETFAARIQAAAREAIAR